MAGTPKGKIDCLIDSTVLLNDFDRCATLYVSCYRFFKDVLEPAGYVTEYARNDGDGGLGMDYPSIGPNPPGQNAFVVWRWEPFGSRLWPFYMLFQFNSSGTSSQNNYAPTAPVVFPSFSSGYGFGLQVVAAFDSGGVAASPWNGTTGSLGSDTKPQPPLMGTSVWKAPAGGKVYTLPHPNQEGGLWETYKEGLLEGFVDNSSAFDLRFHFIADRDNFIFLHSRGDNGLYGCAYTGLYTPRPSLGINHPLFAISEDSQTQEFFEVGGYTGSHDSGLAVGFNQDVSILDPKMYSWGRGVNNLYSPPGYLVTPMPIHATNGYVGISDPAFAGFVSGTVSGDDESGLARVIFGSSITTDYKIVVPWDGINTPGVNTTFQGINF